MEQTAIEVARNQAEQTARSMMAVRKVESASLDPAKVAEEEGLDTETFMKWGIYLSQPQKMEHPFLKQWLSRGGSDEEAGRIAAEFQKLVLDVIAEKRPP